MSIPASYLIPQVVAPTSQDSSMLGDLVQQLMESHIYAVQSAKSLLTSAPLHSPRFNALLKDRATTIAHAKFYMTGSGFGVAYCTFMSLSNVCRNVIELAQTKLLPYARVLDQEDSVSESHLTLARAEFRAQLANLKAACCASTPDASNLMWSVQTLMPSLSKLSGQIDNVAHSKQEMISLVPQVEALPHLAQLSHIKNFNVHVNQVLTVAQSILNMMSDWQDRLDLLIDEPEELLPNGFYEDQVNAALAYWQGLQVTLTEHLRNQNDSKSKATMPISNVTSYPFRAQPWRPKLTASESWS